MSISIKEIQSLFAEEFHSVKDKFILLTLPINQVKSSQDRNVTLPGVYVWWSDGEVFKVGRHLRNARKRALEHLKDNTGNKLASLAGNASAKLLLFNVPDSDNLHWAIALEDYFEQHLAPIVPSKRRG